MKHRVHSGSLKTETKIKTKLPELLKRNIQNSSLGPIPASNLQEVACQDHTPGSSI